MNFLRTQQPHLVPSSNTTPQEQEGKNTFVTSMMINLDIVYEDDYVEYNSDDDAERREDEREKRVLNDYQKYEFAMKDFAADSGKFMPNMNNLNMLGNVDALPGNVTNPVKEQMKKDEAQR